MKKGHLRSLMALKASDKVWHDPNDHHEVLNDSGLAWDDLTGEPLDPKEVKKARATEISYVRMKKVWVKIPRHEAIRRGWKIIRTRWIDINKGDKLIPLHRSRFVGKEFNDGDGEGLFAATPPLEAVKVLVSDAATDKSQNKIMMINDVARAFFEAPMTRKLCIELPEEDLEEGERGQNLVGLLLMSLYGTRDAAANFQEVVRKTMCDSGFVRGKYNPATYWHPARKIKSLVHGDDFISTGRRECLKWMKEVLQKMFEIKTKLVGHGPEEENEVRVLNRVIRATPQGWEYEADQRHAETIIKELRLEDAKEVKTPGEDVKARLEEEDEKELDGRDTTMYRRLTARANYLSADRSDIQYATKEVCRGMSKPTRGDQRKLRRLGRYLVGCPRVVHEFRWQVYAVELSGYSDSDWAGSKRTARSTSGGAIVRGGHCLKTWATTQKSVTLSSGEAELVAVVKTSAEVIGILQLMKDWGMETQGRIYVDSSAALGVVGRKGNGKLRHIKVRLLWIQEREEREELEYSKVLGTENPADWMTKYLGQAAAEKYGLLLDQRPRTGRAREALKTTC